MNFRCSFCFLFVFSLSIISLSAAHDNNMASAKRSRRFHSGIYGNVEEEYAGAFLMSKSRFLSAAERISKANYPEQIVLNSIKPDDSCRLCENFLTRDFLDFSVEHLSSTTNILNVLPLSTAQKRDIFQLLEDRLVRHISYLKHPRTRSRVAPSTSSVAVVAFSDNEANSNVDADDLAHQERLRRIRHSFFKATVFGLLRHFASVVVYVAKEEDEKRVGSWSLPLLQIINLHTTLAAVPAEKYFRHRPVEQLLPKYALLDVVARLTGQHNHTTGGQSQGPSQRVRKKWGEFSSVFYTEGDQVLQLRKLRYLYQMFAASDGNFLFIPHRLQTLPLYENFPPAVQKAWSYRRAKAPVSLVTQQQGQGASASGGSCCDNGRLDLPSCGNWWYFCEDWGVANYSSWLKFGQDGFTNALVTEHQGLCAYSPQHVRCPAPPQCPPAAVRDAELMPGGAAAAEYASTHDGGVSATKFARVRKYLRDLGHCSENTYNRSFRFDSSS